MASSEVVFQLFATDPGLDLRSLYRSAMQVGEDHVSAMINTLFMAYAGAALPTLVLLTLSQESFLHLINLEFIAEEVVRTLVGSLGLIAAAPISTGIACLLAVNQQRLRAWAQSLRPERDAG
ncbi:MAG: YibE/F family protein [Anaerolineales bacterium]